MALGKPSKAKGWGILVLLTLAHLSIRILGGQGTGEALLVSPMAQGDLLPPLDSGWVVGDGTATTVFLPGEPCRLVVAVDPACPHCRTAIRRRFGLETKSAFPVTWLTKTKEYAFQEMRDSIRTEDRVVVQEEAFRNLKVEAVPAAFLATDGRILDVWPFRGSESDTELRKKCRAGKDWAAN